MKRKAKSHSGAKKRFRFTSSGKVKYKKAGKRHLLIGMSSKHARELRKPGILDKTNIKVVKAKLPYSN
ncbi:MAG: 50S ribosomal protein L35 [Endomicrobia bacterium]|nr:50S ribosomal protein L35 [Endomicrobiia bacterium]